LATKITTVKKPMNEAERIRVRDQLMLKASRRMGCDPKDLFVAICVYNPDRFYEWCSNGEVPSDSFLVLDDDVRELAQRAVYEYFDGVKQILLPDFISDACLDIMTSSKTKSLDPSFKKTLFAIVRESNRK